MIHASQLLHSLKIFMEANNMSYINGIEANDMPYIKGEESYQKLYSILKDELGTDNEKTINAVIEFALYLNKISK